MMDNNKTTTFLVRNRSCESGGLVCNQSVNIGVWDSVQVRLLVRTRTDLEGTTKLQNWFFVHSTTSPNFLSRAHGILLNLWRIPVTYKVL